jgi:GNAT superfamily N-acetyltransferase
LSSSLTELGPPWSIRPAHASDIAQCIVIRGQTRENPIPAQRLAELGITEATWGAQVAQGELVGYVARHGETMAGYCFGDARTGEVVVLALLPAFERQGLGRRLLQTTMAHLRGCGHARLFLGADDRPHIRAYGFYRHLGWVPSGHRDERGDEELVYRFAP